MARLVYLSVLLAVAQIISAQKLLVGVPCTSGTCSKCGTKTIYDELDVCKTVDGAYRKVTCANNEWSVAYFSDEYCGNVRNTNPVHKNMKGNVGCSELIHSVKILSSTFSDCALSTEEKHCATDSKKCKTFSYTANGPACTELTAYRGGDIIYHTTTESNGKISMKLYYTEADCQANKNIVFQADDVDEGCVDYKVSVKSICGSDEDIQNAEAQEVDDAEEPKKKTATKTIVPGVVPAKKKTATMTIATAAATNATATTANTGATTGEPTATASATTNATNETSNSTNEILSGSTNNTGCTVTVIILLVSMVFAL